MKKNLTLPALAVFGGAAAFLLRLLQNRTGFEPDTGLPIPGNLPGLALVILLVLLAAVICVLVGKLPGEQDPGPAFPADFSTTEPKLLMLPVMGVLLTALSGLMELAQGLGIAPPGAPGLDDAYVLTADMEVWVPGHSFSQTAMLLMGLLSAAGLLLAVSACRPREGRKPIPGTVLLIVPAALVVRLVLTYRTYSVDPALEAYYVELLALVFLTLAFYRLSSFAFQAGRTRRFALYASPAVVLSLAALASASASNLSAPLLYLGGALTLLGFLLLRLCRPDGDYEAHHSTSEE